MKPNRQLLAIFSMVSIVLLVVLSCKDSTQEETSVNQNDSCYKDRPNNDTTSIIIYKEQMTDEDSIALVSMGLKKTLSCPCDPNLQLWGDATEGISIYGHEGLANNGRNQPGGAGGENDIKNLGFQISPNYYVRSGDITTPIDTKYLTPFDSSNYDNTNLIGVMDTGILSKGNLWKNTEDDRNDGIDNDHNGLVNDFQGWNFVDNNNNISYHTPKPHHHGTFVKYLIERELQGKLKYGIVPMKVLDDNNKGNLFDMFCAMAYATKIPNLKTLNASLGYYGDPSKVLTTMIEKLKKNGIMLVTAAGNSDSSDICEVRNGKNPRDLANRKHKFYPAAYSKAYKNVISATTIHNANFTICEKQNFSINHVDIGVMGDAKCDFVFRFLHSEQNNLTVDSTYSQWGTSYASPVAAAYSFIGQISRPTNGKNDILVSNAEIKTVNYSFLTKPSLGTSIKGGKTLIRNPN